MTYSPNSWWSALDLLVTVGVTGSLQWVNSCRWSRKSMAQVPEVFRQNWSLMQIIQILAQEICLFLLNRCCMLNNTLPHIGSLSIIDQPHKYIVRKSYESESDLMLWCWKRLDDHFLMCIYGEHCSLNNVKSTKARETLHPGCSVYMSKDMPKGFPKNV